MRTVLGPDQLSDLDRRLIDLLQEPLPIESRPFGGLAKAMGADEAEIVERIVHLREVGAITRYGPFYDAVALGGAFCLCAIEVPDERFDEVMTKVNAMPEVAHNYEREHRLNMWFVLATETPEQIEKSAVQIEKETGLKVHRFPKLEEFFIGFRVAATQ